MMKKIVLIADIVSSRQNVDRKKLQLDLEKTLMDLNNRNLSLISPYTITLGDEFQAVFSNSDSIFLDAVEILVKLYPMRIRFSYGIGNISTNIKENSSIGMDGPAFYLARDGIDDLKGKSELFKINGITNQSKNLINQSLSIFSQQLLKWKETRLLVFNLYLQGKLPKEIAAKLQVSEQAIYKNINAGMLELFKGQFVEIAKIVNEEIS